MNKNLAYYDIFISYRRDGGFETAKHLNDLLVHDSYIVSFDIDTLREGDFDSPASDVTISSRKGFNLDERSKKVGFRLIVRRALVREPCKQCNGTGILETGVYPSCNGMRH